jgi:hypothetical protein
MFMFINVALQAALSTFIKSLGVVGKAAMAVNTAGQALIHGLTVIGNVVCWFAKWKCIDWAVKGMVNLIGGPFARLGRLF